MSRKLLSDLYKGAWDNSTAYTVGDVVENDGTSYACIEANTNQEPPNATYWAILASKGDTGSQGTQGTKGIVWQGEWSAGTYNADDAVEYQGTAYIATVLTTGEPTVSSDWETLAKRGLYWKGSWSAGTYDLDDAVYNDGSSYVANKETSEEPSESATDWDLLSRKGEVQGPASSTDENIAVFDGVSGKAIKDGGKTVAEKADVDSPVFTTKIQTPQVELGHASDTTISRSEAGRMAVEGKEVLLTNKGLADLHLTPYQQITPGLTLKVSAANVYFGGTLVEFSGDNSPSFTAPSANPRIDVLSINSSGTLVRTAGTEAASPSTPDVPAGNIPICSVYNRVGQTSVKEEDDSTNGYIYKDLRRVLTRRDIFTQNIHTFSDTLKHSNDTERSTSITNLGISKIKEILVNDYFSNVRVKYEAKTEDYREDKHYVQVRLNGVNQTSDSIIDSYRSFSYDLSNSVGPGDLIQIYVQNTLSGTYNYWVRNFRLYFDVVPDEKSIYKIDKTLVREYRDTLKVIEDADPEATFTNQDP